MQSNGSMKVNEASIESLSNATNGLYEACGYKSARGFEMVGEWSSDNTPTKMQAWGKVSGVMSALNTGLEASIDVRVYGRSVFVLFDENGNYIDLEVDEFKTRIASLVGKKCESNDTNLQQTKDNSKADKEIKAPVNKKEESKDKVVKGTKDKVVKGTKDKDVKETKDKAEKETKDKVVKGTKDKVVKGTKEKTAKETKDKAEKETKDKDVNVTKEKTAKETKDKDVKVTKEKTVKEKENATEGLKSKDNLLQQKLEMKEAAEELEDQIVEEDELEREEYIAYLSDDAEGCGKSS